MLCCTNEVVGTLCHDPCGVVQLIMTTHTNNRTVSVSLGSHIVVFALH
jgi:hypothetical protein